MKNSNTHGLKKGDRITINSPGSPVDGMSARFVKQSRSTGNCRVELCETRGKYERGDVVCVQPYEIS